MASFQPVSFQRTQPDHEAQHFPYTADYFEKFNVKERSDTRTSDIWSICQLADDTFLILDGNNNKLKRLDQSLKVQDSVELPRGSQRVCAAGPGQAAVSVMRDKKIHFVSVGKELTLTISLTIGNYCRGIVYIGDELFVCCEDIHNSSSAYIEVYNKAGELQRTVASEGLSSLPLYITVTDDGQHFLYTTHNSNNVTMMDLAGKTVNTFSHKDLKKPTGICTDGKGQVFVCGLESNTVIQLSPKHQKIEVILTGLDEIMDSRGLYFDRRLSRLFVSSYDSNMLYAYTLK